MTCLSNPAFCVFCADLPSLEVDLNFGYVRLFSEAKCSQSQLLRHLFHPEVQFLKWLLRFLVVTGWLCQVSWPTHMAGCFHFKANMFKSNWGFLSEQAKVRKNRVMQIIFRILACCLWCFELLKLWGWRRDRHQDWQSVFLSGRYGASMKKHKSIESMRLTMEVTDHLVSIQQILWKVEACLTKEVPEVFE